MTGDERPTSRTGADAQLGRRHAAVAGHLVPGLPRDALVDRAAGPKGWRCLTCHPPDHLPAEAIRREGEADGAPGPAAPRAPHGEADPLFRQAGIDLDGEG